MKVAVLGGGITGLTIAYELSKKGDEVILIEKDKELGGLAGSFNYKNFSLEKYYHHIFQSDAAAIKLAEELGIGDKLHFYSSKNGIFYNGQLHNFSLPTDVFKVSILTWHQRVRLALVLGQLKFADYGRWMDEVSALDWLDKELGQATNAIFWQPLLEAKFAEFAGRVPLTWFWARLKNRTLKLGYFDGGFVTLYGTLEKAIKKNGVKIITDTIVSKVSGKTIQTNSGKFTADKIISTLPLKKSLDILVDLPVSFKNKHQRIKYRHGLNLVLILKKPLSDYYWISVHNTDEKFLAMVNHSRLIDAKNYKNLHPVYLGNYLPEDHPYFSMNEEQLLKEYLPTIKKIASDFSEKLVEAKFKFVGDFGQPVVGLNHQELIPPITTPIKDVYLATMSQVYPADRGINYAVDLGQKAAKIITN